MDGGPRILQPVTPNPGFGPAGWAIQGDYRSPPLNGLRLQYARTGPRVQLGAAPSSSRNVMSSSRASSTSLAFQNEASTSSNFSSFSPHKNRRLSSRAEPAEAFGAGLGGVAQSLTLSASGHGASNFNSDLGSHSSNGVNDRSYDSNGSGSRDQGNWDRDGNDPGGNRSNGSASGGSGGDDSYDKDAEVAKARKANPLVDLIETEAAYVSELSKVIKKVAAAWSRSNFPPPELDTMFRNIEAVYRVNRSFLKALREIGPNPSSPKALGDLLMRWIDDLEAPYTRYCDSYLADFDAWPAVQTNARLPALLDEISGSHNPDGTPVVFSDKKRNPDEPWTLDAFFALPQIRLKYYKKLYGRLLKSTQPGRSDHRLLVGANEKLDDLLERSKKRINVSVLDNALVAGRDSHSSSFADSNKSADTSRGRVSSATSATSESQRASPGSKPTHPQQMTSKSPSVSPALRAVVHQGGNGLPPDQLFQQQQQQQPAVLTSQGLASLSKPHVAPDQITGSFDSMSLRQRSDNESFDNETISARNSTRSTEWPIEDLEQRLDTGRTLDIFTMKPKKCQLQMNPPNLPFKRALRKSADVVINFVPTSTGQEVVVRRAHIFLLTDLFLICERMSPSEKAERGANGSGPDLWLLYPPLAGKHLRVTDLGGQGNAISVLVLKKEKLDILTESREAKEDWMRHFDDCQKFAGSLGLKLKTGQSLAAPSPASAAPGSSPSTPGLSPAISVTPDSGPSNMGSTASNNLGNMFSPHSSTGSNLAREGSFNSVASFPKVPPIYPPGPGSAASNGSPDLRIPPVSSPGFMPSPRSASPSQPLPGPMNGRPFGPGGVYPGSRPGLTSPNGNLRSPDNSPGFGPIHMGPGGLATRPRGPGDSYGLPPRSPSSGPTGMPGHSGYGPNPPTPGGPPGPPYGAAPNGSSPGPGSAPISPRGYGLGTRPPPPPPVAASGDAQGWGGQYREPGRMPSAPNLRSASGSSSNGNGRGSGENLSDSGLGPNGFVRSRSVSSQGSTAPKLPSEMLRSNQGRPGGGENDISPPSSPEQKRKGPVRSSIAAQMRCKLYLKQAHQQWKSLGNARLKLYHILPDDIRQLVVENDRKTLISTIVLTDGVERVGKVGVAVELSDQGNRTGIVYMLQMRSEESAGGLFGQLLEGSDRTVLSGSR